jgi:quercetin dioxygenase-like cupin family protein
MQRPPSGLCSEKSSASFQRCKQAKAEFPRFRSNSNPHLGAQPLADVPHFHCRQASDKMGIMSSAYRIERWAELYAPNAAMLRQHMTAEGYSVFQWADQPEMVYGPHTHSDDQSHWVVSGKLELTIERVGVFVLEAGDRDFMPAGTRHSARVLGEEPVVYLIGAK